MTAVADQGPVLTRAQVLARGWTRAMVTRLLDPADERRPNPFYRSASPMHLYRLDRIERAEAGEEFTRLARTARLRSARARATAGRRREALLAEVRGVAITLPSLSAENLARAAVRHRNDREAERCYLLPDQHYEPATVEGVDARTLARWQVNYLRHQQSGYDALLRRVAGRVGRAEAVRLIRAKLYRSIAAAYPGLGRECDRQLHLRDPEEVPRPLDEPATF